MKADLDRLMAARGLDALIVAGGEEYSAIRDYMTNGAHITGGLILKKRDGNPMLIVSGMELEEAMKSGLTVMTYAELDYYKIYEKVGNDPIKATIAFWAHALGLVLPSGKVGVYGTGSINGYIELARLLAEAHPQYQFVGELGTTLFDEAFMTKGPEEIARIRSVAERTMAALEETWDFIAGHTADGGETLRKADGAPLTIGDVKRFVRRALLDYELEDTGMIFAQGKDGGYPHSRGESDMPLRLGQAIVFDLFPRELGGGYHHDVTRTWCIGYAPEAVQKAYDDVLTAFDIAVESFGLGKPTHLMQEAVLDHFEARGHSTMRANPQAMSGYVHSLGHGVGLLIHERPAITHLRKEDSFQIGNCITIEPGLYYPDDGYGVRIEDLFIVTDNGQLESLTTFRKDLVLPLRNNRP